MSGPDLLGYDDYDLVYWEQRMGRWGWQKFCDGDFGHRVLLPFNDRRLLETMLSLPYPLRRDKVLFHRLLDDLGVREPARGPAAPQRASPARPGVAAPSPPGPTRLRRLTDLLPWRRTPRPADPAGPHDADPTPQGPGLPWGYALVARRSPSTSIPDGFLHTELDKLLRGLGVTRVLCCGLVTSACVLSTALGAFHRGYDPVLLSDACADRTRERQATGEGSAPSGRAVRAGRALRAG